MNFKIALHSDVGIKKDTNQDSCCIKVAATEKGNVLLAVICDGMGGLSKGEVASANLIRTFSDWFDNELPHHLAKETPLKEIEYRWNRMIKEQNQIIAAYGRKLHLQLGSTITAVAILENGQYIIGHVGDTRAYRITEKSIELLTDDQTVVAKKIKEGELKPEEAEDYPLRHVLIQCVGASKIVEPVFYYGQVNSNECCMLCSDGFRHVITAEEIQNAFAPQNNPDEVTMKEHIQKLTELNKYRHENDNITALLIKIV